MRLELEDSSLKIYIDDSQVNTPASDCNQEESIGIGNREQYDFNDNEITAMLSVSCNKTQHCGSIYTNYTFSDGSFHAGDIWYEVIDQYGD